MATSFLSCTYFKCKDNSKLKMKKKKPYYISLLPSSDHSLYSFFTLYPAGVGKRGSKERRDGEKMRQERQPVTERK